MDTAQLKASKASQPPGLVINGLAIALFLISLYCCATPALQLLYPLTLSNLIFAPLLLTLTIHFGLMAWMNLWVIVIWGWVICAIRYRCARHRRGRGYRWWIAPLLLWLLSLLWITQIPIALHFSLYQSALAQLTNTVSHQSQEWADLDQQIGLFHIIGASKLTDGGAFTGKISIVMDGIGAYQGLIYDPSPQTESLEAIRYSFAPGSNNGDQEVYYLWDGWYVFQNYFD